MPGASLPPLPDASSPAARDLHARLTSGDATVGIIGLGYVGLPIALAFTADGLQVLGFDVDDRKVAALAEGRSYIGHLDGERLRAALESDRFSATADFSRLGEPDALLICVPTPLTAQRDPDLRYVTATARAIAETLREGQLVVLESTTYPGTTDEVVRPILDATGHACGRDYFLAFSPEREDPGKGGHTASSIPKVVGGVEPTSTALAAALYTHLSPRVVPVSSAAAAEATKITENVFRAVNIALVNELKVVYDRLGIDVWEVLDAAETKGFGFMRFNPGPGWGGHCIPIDPFYLSWRAREHDVNARFIELAGEVNVRTVDFVLEKLVLALNRHRKPVAGSRVLLLGLAYKRDVDDPRESPAFAILDRLLELEADVAYHDPHIPVAPAMRSWPDLPRLHSVDLTDEELARTDAVLIVTDHSNVDYAWVLEHAPLIVDTRGVYRGESGKVVRA